MTENNEQVKEPARIQRIIIDDDEYVIEGQKTDIDLRKLIDYANEYKFMKTNLSNLVDKITNKNYDNEGNDLVIFE